MSYEEIKLKIDSLREKVAAYGKLTTEQLKKINYKFRLEWNYTSNSMEGNTLTIDETRSVMVGNIDVHQKPYKHVAEMKGHDEVISEILRVGKGEIRLSESRIKQIHTSIMYEESDEMKERVGDWKKQNNHIINRKGEKFDFADWETIPDKIHDLLNRTNAAIDALYQGKKKNIKHPVDIALDFHLEYLTIHPFYDGNGRTARILTNLILISFGYPPFWITEKEKDVYYAYLTDIQGYGGDRKLLDAFMAGLILRSEQLVVNVIEGVDIEEEDDLYKEIALWKSQIVKNEDIIPYSVETITQLYYNSFRNLFEEVIDKTSKFDDLFDTKYITNNADVDKNISVTVNHLEHFDEVFEVVQSTGKMDRELIELTQPKYRGRIHSLRLTLSYIGFKNDGLNTFSLYSEILIVFESYKYYICINNSRDLDGAIVVKLFSQPLTHDEIKMIVRTVVSNLFESVKSSMKNRINPA